MIHLVVLAEKHYTQSYIKKTIPPQLNTMFFEEAEPFIAFLSTLKIPTQILIQRDLSPVEPSTFLYKYHLHQIFFLQESVSAPETLPFLAQGGLVFSWNELPHQIWWWNKTAIEQKKIKTLSIKDPSIIALLQPLDKHQWDHTLASLAHQHQKRFLNISCLEWPKTFDADCWYYASDFAAQSPRHQKKLLEHTATSKGVLFLNLEPQPSLFEYCLDWLLPFQQGLYRLSQKNIRSLKTSNSDSLEDCLVFEYLRYTWFAGQAITQH